ncbi:titin-like isoform X1 [Prunus avium]|uniref:Titin-like isoform X1 n=1 Tax=Prunus avium TaxID=42229 RepID=A0A6P5TTP6_PRUAV|nr:titin-like isoform X1 [Prunus avium]
MATETAASHHVPTTDDEQVEKKVSEEEKASEKESVSLPQGSGEEITKTEDATSLATPAESEGVDHKNIEPPVVEAEKTNGAPVPDVPVGVETKVENESIADSQTPAIPKQVADAAESPIEVKTNIESVVGEAPKEPSIGIIEIGQVEQPKIVDAPQSSVEAIEKPKESVATVLKEIKDSEPELAIAKVEEKPKDQSEFSRLEKKHDEEPEERLQDETVKDEGSVADKVEHITFLEQGKIETVDTPSLAVEEEPEQPKLTAEEKKYDEVEPEKSVEDGGVKDDGSSFGKVEEPTFLEEGKTDRDDKPSLIETPEEASLSREAQIKLQDEGDSSLPEVTEKITTEDQKKESSGVDVVEKLAEEAAVETEKFGEENVETGNVERENVETEDTTQPIKEDRKKEISGFDVVEKLAEKAVELDTVGEKEVETEEDVKETIEDEKKELNGADVIDKQTEEAEVKFEKVEEENVAKNVETEDNEKRNVISEDSAKPIEEKQKKEVGGVDVVEKLAEVAAVKLENVENVISEDSSQPIEEEQKKEVGGVGVVEKLAEVAAVKLENVENVISEDSSQPIEEEQKKEVGGVGVVEKLAAVAAVKLENVENVISEDSSQPIEEEQKKEVGGVGVVEKLAAVAAVKLENVENVISEDSSQPIEEEQKKEVGGFGVVEKLAEVAAVKLENVGEEKVEKNDGIEENEKINVITEDSTQPIQEDLKKELSGVDVVEKLAEEAVVEIEKSGEENETKNVKLEENEIRNVINEVSTQPLEEEVNSSISPAEVTEKSFEGAEKYVEPAVENERAEQIKDETPAKVETKKDESVEEKQDEVTRADEPLKDSKQSESEVKGEDKLEEKQDETDAGKLEKVDDDVAKSKQNIEPPPTKDGDQTKPSQDLPKEAPAKPSQKQSNTILSKVKQSLVKAKKAIIGKSPSSKNPASGTKDDIKVK